MELKVKWVDPLLPGHEPFAIPTVDSTKENFDELEEQNRNLHDEIIELQDGWGEIIKRLTALEGWKFDLDIFFDNMELPPRLGDLERSVKELEAKDAPEKSCPQCGGTGLVPYELDVPDNQIMHGVAEGPCPQCNGTGKLAPTCGKKVEAKYVPVRIFIYCDECIFEPFCFACTPDNWTGGCYTNEKQPPNTDKKVDAPDKPKCSVCNDTKRVVEKLYKGPCPHCCTMVYCVECDLGDYCFYANQRGIDGCIEGKVKQSPDICGNCIRAARWDNDVSAVYCGDKLKVYPYDRPGCLAHIRRMVHHERRKA